MSNHDYKTAAVEYLYAFRAGQFYKPEADTLKYLIENKTQVISEILNLPLGSRINQGALIRKNSFKAQYTDADWIKELSTKSWLYFGCNDKAKDRVIKRINSIDRQFLAQLVSDFIETNLGIDCSKKNQFVCVRGISLE